MIRFLNILIWIATMLLLGLIGYLAFVEKQMNVGTHLRAFFGCVFFFDLFLFFILYFQERKFMDKLKANTMPISQDALMQEILKKVESTEKNVTTFIYPLILTLIGILFASILVMR